VYFVLKLNTIVTYLRNNIHIPQFDRQLQERYASLQVATLPINRLSSWIESNPSKNYRWRSAAFNYTVFMPHKKKEELCI